MKEEIVKFANVSHQKIIADEKLDAQMRLYKSSMPLLALATVKDKDGYHVVLNSMELITKNDAQLSQIPKPWQLWMLGRMAIASKLAGDMPKLAEIKEILSEQLAANDNKDAITGWAFAYLAAIDKDTYDKCQEKLKEYTEYARTSYLKDPKPGNASDFGWTLVMNLYAAASTDNKADYAQFLQEMKEVSPQNSLKATTELVPEDDYRLWLVSVARYSFALMNDKVSLKELEKINGPEISNFDSMLALANELLTEPLVLSSTKKPSSFYKESSAKQDPTSSAEHQAQP